MAAGAVGGSKAPEEDELTEEMLGWRPEMVDLLAMELERAGRDDDEPPVAVVLETGGRDDETPAAACEDALGLEVCMSGASVGARLSRMAPSPLGEGNWVRVNSVEAEAMLVWRSSKLTEGRKSWGAARWSADEPASPFRAPKDKRECLLEAEALSIGALDADAVLALAG